VLLYIYIYIYIIYQDMKKENRRHGDVEKIKAQSEIQSFPLFKDRFMKTYRGRGGVDVKLRAS
jgi:hypothetical protein